MFIFGLKDATFILKANILSLIKVFRLSWPFICGGWDGLSVCFNKHMNLREVKK